MDFEHIKNKIKYFQLDDGREARYDYVTSEFNLTMVIADQAPSLSDVSFNFLAYKDNLILLTNNTKEISKMKFQDTFPHQLKYIQEHLLLFIFQLTTLVSNTILAVRLPLEKSETIYRTAELQSSNGNPPKFMVLD